MLSLITYGCNERQQLALANIYRQVLKLSRRSVKMHAEVEETLLRIEAHGSVTGTIVANADGIPIRSTFDSSKAGKYVEALRHLTTMARSTVRDLDPQNDLIAFRISTKNQEIMIAPENSYLLMLVQRFERYVR